MVPNGRQQLSISRISYSFFTNSRYMKLRVLDKISVAHAPMERSGTLTAPLPGRVVRTLVKTNDVVTTGQKLMVIEAMKNGTSNYQSFGWNCNFRQLW